MPDINPAALSHGGPVTSTPILPPKSALSSATSKSKVVPPRIDLEPLYTALKHAVGDNWSLYKESVGLFILGQLNQKELSTRIDGFLLSSTSETEHLHNQLIAAIFANVTREMPDIGVAGWVSANDKPTSGAGSKPIAGDIAEQRLKTEIAQLPNRDRRRLKELTQNDFDPYDAFATMLGEHRRSRPVRAQLHETLPNSANALGSKTNVELEIRKRYTHPLASESGEFPDAATIESRMLPICYEVGLINGHVAEAAHFMSVAAETFIKEVLAALYSKVRSNGPGSGGSAGNSTWIQTHKYHAQLAHDEEAWLRGEVLRDKNGLLPAEARAASERGPLGMADVRTALELGDCNLGQMPIVIQQIMLGYREGELEAWNDYTMLVDGEAAPAKLCRPASSVLVESKDVNITLQGSQASESTHTEDWGWEGVADEDSYGLDVLLDSCLIVGA